MGIYHFFGWFRNQFRPNLRKVYLYDLEGKLRPISNMVSIDIFAIDMNSLLHDSAQHVYKYGKGTNSSFKGEASIDAVQKHVSETLNNLVSFIKPNKTLLLCIDGPAPFSKMCQQRKRRYKSAMDTNSETKLSSHKFDSNCITPGTEFMHFLCSHLDNFVRDKVATDPIWSNFQVIFSSEKVPGEGEAKIMSYIRKYGARTDTYCVYGPDADLIMLTLATHLPRMYVLREDTNTPNAFFLINIFQTHKELANDILKWESEHYKYNNNLAVDDFVFLCFVVGNDFLPHIPSLEILESGIDIIIEVYKEVGSKYGHIIKRQHKELNSDTFNTEALAYFLECISYFEKSLLEKKLSKSEVYFPDEILQNAVIETGLDIEKYRKDYSSKHFENNVEDAVRSYIQGLDWVLTYYKFGVPCWNWFYPYHYAPSASDILKYISVYKRPKYRLSIPFLPFQQLLAVLPPKSASLLPSSISSILETETQFRKQFCPDTPDIDLSGKKNDWQAIVLLPKVQPEDILQVYKTKSSSLKKEDLQRNIYEKSISYTYNETGVNTNNIEI